MRGCCTSSTGGIPATAIAADPQTQCLQPFPDDWATSLGQLVDQRDLALQPQCQGFTVAPGPRHTPSSQFKGLSRLHGGRGAHTAIACACIPL